MKKSDSKNGITIERNIELVMSNTGNVSLWYYIAQLIMLIIVCSSICYCYITGVGIEGVSAIKMIGVITIFCIFFFLVFLAKAFYKYTIPSLLVLYGIIGYITQEILTEGFSQLVNPLIDLYNNYFGASLSTFFINSPYSTTEMEFFLSFLMFFVIAVAVYTVLHGRSILCYLIVSVPFVFLPFIVGEVPGLVPYVLYVIGTITIFISAIAEKYGLFTKINKQHIRSDQWFYPVERTRVKIQIISFSVLVFLVGLTMSLYTPTWYEEEFDVKQVRYDIQKTMKDITTGNYFKDSVFSDMFKVKTKHGNSGLSNGKLGTVGSLKYDNKTALRVTTTFVGDGAPCYLKGFVGESYSPTKWNSLSKSDQTRLEELEERLLTVGNVENLPSQFFDVLRSSPYQIYRYSVKSMSIENVSAEDSVDYVPYLLQQKQSLSGGKISTKAKQYTYYSFNPFLYDETLSPLNSVYKNVNIVAAYQLNLINTKIMEDMLGIEIDSNWLYTLTEEQKAVLYGNVLDIPSDSMGIPRNQVTQNENILSNPVSLVSSNKEITLNEVVNSIASVKEYQQDEREYFELVKDIYTKLPDSGLDGVKDLVKDHVVTIETNSDGTPDYVEQIDGTSLLSNYYNMYSIYNADANGEAGTGEDYVQRKYYEAVEYVQNYLSQNASYSLQPGITPSGKDFVEYFLFENKKGYCMHFASSAVVMLRAMGVPCRYAEGYLITNQDYASGRYVSGEYSTMYNPNEYSEVVDVVEIDIKDTNAHAWIEVYMPGLGWMPFEVTGSYTVNNQIEIPPTNVDPTATLKPTLRPTVTPTLRPTLRPTLSPKPSVSPTAKPNTTSKPTTKPSHVPGGVSGNSGGPFDSLANWYRGLPKVVHRIVHVILTILILIVATIATILIRRILVLRSRERSLNKVSTNQGAILYYHLLDRLLRRKSIIYTTNKPYEDYVKEMVKEYPFLQEEEVSRYMKVILKAKFNQKEISTKEVTELKQFYRYFIKESYNNSSKWMRWYYKYIFLLE